MEAEHLAATSLRAGSTGGRRLAWRAPRPELVTFRRAAVALGAVGPERADGSPESERAAAALLAMATGGDPSGLAAVLRPDPAADQVTWTVACYRIGDFIPSALVDFPTAAEAVARVCSCPDPSHVAAELVASTEDGLRWTALSRRGRQLGFQLPGKRTATDASAGDPSLLASALARWEEQLGRWRADPDEDVAPEPGAIDGDPGADPGRGSLVSGVPLSDLVAELSRLAAGVEDSRVATGALADRLERIERQLHELTERLDRPGPPCTPPAVDATGSPIRAAEASPPAPAGDQPG